MSPLLKIKYKKKDKTYFFHHGFHGRLNQDTFQKIISSCLDNKKRVFPLLLLEKKFIQFYRYTDNYSLMEAEGFFLNLKIPLQKIFAHGTFQVKKNTLPRIPLRQITSTV